MSLPWFPTCTGAVVAATRRSHWSRASPCPEYVALVELGALHYSGLLEHESLTLLARGWGRGNRWSRRVICGWSAWYDSLDLKTRSPLPAWLVALTDAPVMHSCPSTSRTGSPEESLQVASTDAPVMHRQRTGDAPRARSTLIEEDSEGDIPAPAPWPTTGLKSPLTEADIVAWSAYRRHLSPTKGLTSSRRGKLRARVKAIGLDRWVTYCDWLATSRHERAVYLRDRNDPDTALGKEKAEKYLEYLDEGEGAPAVDPATAAVALLDAEVARYGRGDPPVRGGRVVRPMTDPPGLPGLADALLAALPSVGGWSRWCAADSYERPRLARRLGDEVATLYRGAA